MALVGVEAASDHSLHPLLMTCAHSRESETDTTALQLLMTGPKLVFSFWLAQTLIPAFDTMFSK